MNLIAAAIIGIAVIVLLIAACKVHPFLSLLAGSFVMAVCAGVPFDKAFDISLQAFLQSKDFHDAVFHA